METIKLGVPVSCADCGAVLKIGETVRVYMKKDGERVFYCFGKHKNPLPISQLPQSPKQDGIAKVVDLRLKKAQEIVKANNPGIENYPEQFYMLEHEALHQLYGESWKDKDMD